MRQGLFYGPPGTGKTHVARQLARHLASSPAHVQLAQFHASYSYEDFIEGLRPEPLADTGILRDSVRPGLFQEFCNRARTARDETFVFIIDEMNRADLAAVFGELLMLLEYRGEVVVLPYSQQRFSLPRNVVVLGTMNTADRSLALVDFALRRRFNAFPLAPSPFPAAIPSYSSHHCAGSRYRRNDSRCCPLHCSQLAGSCPGAISSTRAAGAPHVVHTGTATKPVAMPALSPPRAAG